MLYTTFDSTALRLKTCKHVPLLSAFLNCDHTFDGYRFFLVQSIVLHAVIQ